MLVFRVCPISLVAICTIFCIWSGQIKYLSCDHPSVKTPLDVRMRFTQLAWFFLSRIRTQFDYVYRCNDANTNTILWFRASHASYSSFGVGVQVYIGHFCSRTFVCPLFARVICVKWTLEFVELTDHNLFRLLIIFQLIARTDTHQPISTTTNTTHTHQPTKKSARTSNMRINRCLTESF